MKKVFLIIIGLALFAIFSLVGILYARVWDPLWNPFRPEPEAVMQKMMKESEKIKTLHNKIDFSIKGNNEGGFEFVFKIEGDSDNAQPEMPKFDGIFDVAFSAISKEVYFGERFALAGQIKTIEKRSYIEFTTIPTIPNLETYFGFDFSRIKNRWIKIDLESILNFLKEMAGEEWTPDKEKMLRESLEKQNILQKELQDKIQKILTGKKLYLIEKEFSDEEIEGKKVYHYLVSLNKNEIKKIIPEIFKVVEEIMLKEYGFSPTYDKEFEEELDKFFEKIGEFKGEIWIGKKDYLPYKFKGEKEIDLSKLTDGKEKGELIGKIEILNSNFNQKVEIKEPESFESIGKVLEELLRPAIEKSKSQARDTRRMTDLRQIQFAMEMYYAETGRYLVLKTMPEKIGPYLSEVPKDPGSGPCPSYQWISNIKNPQKFCVFACLENGKFYAVSHKGAKELEEKPETLDCW